MKPSRARRQLQDRSHYRPLFVERLDCRTLPSCAFDPTTGILTVNGTRAADDIDVSVDDAGTLSVSLNGQVEDGCSRPASEVLRLVINAGGGNDTVTLGAGVAVPATINGGSGRDSIDGGDGDDEIHGDSGHDSIMGDQGDDVIYGENGKDDLHGGEGNDAVHGDNGKDAIDGDAGDDELYGDNGVDDLDGGDGADMMHGGRGSDSLDGDDESDVDDGDIDLADGDQGRDVVEDSLEVDLDEEFAASLVDLTGALFGEAEFEREFEDDGLELEFEVEVQGLEANKTFEVIAGGVSIGQITTDATGHGELKFSNDPDDDGELAFPDGFPDIHNGTQIVLDSNLDPMVTDAVLQGVFGVEQEDD